MKLVFCPIACHLCLELLFVVYSILGQCGSVGYVSLLTLSFISSLNHHYDNHMNCFLRWAMWPMSLLFIFIWTENVSRNCQIFKDFVFVDFLICAWCTWILIHAFHILWRWKGENVSTNEVANILTGLRFIQDANVYGVEVPGKLRKITFDSCNTIHCTSKSS